MKSEEVIRQKAFVSLRPPPEIPTKIIGFVISIQKLLEAEKIPNESNQNQKRNYQERGDPWVDKNPPRWSSTSTSE